MKKLSKIRNMAICSALAISMVTGCGAAGEAGTANNEKEPVTAETPATPVNVQAGADFNKALIEFVEESGFAQENYMVSPTSFKSALALAVAGADNETKEELIHAMGFENMDEVNAWYASVEHIVASFDEFVAADKEEFKEMKQWLPEDAKEPEGCLLLMNSIWNNTDKNGKFGKDYVKYVKKTYGAEANNVNGKEITEKVNSWVNKGTNGLIPSISNDLSMVNAILVNTLYLKSGWIEEFSKNATKEDEFTTITGEKVVKEFMNTQKEFSYYEDEKGKMVCLRLNGGIEAVFVLGEIENLQEARKQATSEDVIVKIPKFDVETSFSQNEFVSFLEERGATQAFTGDADFSVMCPDTGWMISDILQKTRIKIDEEGLEAAACTAIMMTEGCMEAEPKQPKEFIADEPFEFYICGGANDSEVLFCGQIVK